MKILKETFFDRIRNRMAPPHAVKTIATLQKMKGTGIDYLAVKEASEMVERYKLEAKLSIRQFRAWQLRRPSHAIGEPHHTEQGRILLHSARASAALYLDARRDYLELVAIALAGIRKTRPHWMRDAAND